MRKFSSYVEAIARTEKAKRLFIVLNYSIPVFTGLYIFVNPLSAAVVQEFCFYLSISVLILLLVFRKTSFTLKSPLSLPFVLFFLWAVFGLFFTLDFKNTLHDLRGHLLEYLIIFYLLVNYFNSLKRLEIISWVIIASATIFSIGAVIQYYFIEGFSFSERLGYTFKEMPTDYIGFVTVFAVTLAFHKLQNCKEAMANTILLVVCIPILSITTLLTQSRGSLIGLFAALVILCFSNRKIIIVITALLILTFFIPGLLDRFDRKIIVQNERIKINRLTMEVIKAHPISGIGFGMQIYGNPNLVDLEKENSQLHARYQQDRIITSPHNTFMDIAVRTGIIGLILFLNVLLVSLMLLWRTFRTTRNQYLRSWAICLFAGFISFFIPALFSDTTFGVQAIVFYTMLAMIVILNNISQNGMDENIPYSAYTKNGTHYRLI